MVKFIDVEQTSSNGKSVLTEEVANSTAAVAASTSYLYPVTINLMKRLIFLLMLVTILKIIMPTLATTKTITINQTLKKKQMKNVMAWKKRPMRKMMI